MSPRLASAMNGTLGRNARPKPLERAHTGTSERLEEGDIGLDGGGALERRVDDQAAETLDPGHVR